MSLRELSTGMSGNPANVLITLQQKEMTEAIDMIAP